MKFMSDAELIVHLSSQLTAALIRIQELEEELAKVETILHNQQ